jgi:FkbM family methyltransferase
MTTRVVRSLKYLAKPRAAYKRLRTNYLTHRLTHFLDGVRGVIHVGANRGQQRFYYAAIGADVFWIEADPSVYEDLLSNIAPWSPRQRAICGLVTETDGEECILNIANNEGLSSSVLPFGGHKRIWKDVDYVDQIRLVGQTLPTLLKAEDPTKYDALVMDTQGTELMILRGATNILSAFDRIRIEAADFEVYLDCARADEITAFMREHDFRERLRVPFAESEYGNCFDMLFTR